MRSRFRLFRSIVLACLALLGGISAAPGQEQPWKFIVFGDSLSWTPGLYVNTNIVHELAQEVVAQRAAFLLFLGDFSLNGTDQQLALWTNAMSPVFEAGIPIYPVIGNHDWVNLPAISNIFRQWLPTNGPPGVVGTYALEYRNALFLVLNEIRSGNPEPVDQAWVDAVLATNSRPHAFAAGHMPAFKVQHADCMDDNAANRNVFWNSLSNAHARVYFSGHDHFYDHARIDDGDGIEANDLHQIIVGTGGAPLYPDDAYDGDNGSWNPIRLAHEALNGYVSVKVAGANVSCTWFRRTETNTYIASPEVFAYSSVQRPVLRHQYAGSRLTLSWDGNATLQSGSLPNGDFTNVPAAASPYVLTNFNQWSLFYRLALP